MSNKTIAKFYGFVISYSVIAVFFTGCAFVTSKTETSAPESRYGPPRITGVVKSSDITESSGLAASRCQSNVLWTHNDSGDNAFIFALNGSGDSLGTWKVANAQNNDWEDIASYKDKDGKCFLYVGDIGDNKTRRHDHLIYRMNEPLIIPQNAISNRKEPLVTSEAEILRFTYPDYDQDAETLMVHPKTGNIYIATKRISGPSGIYRVKPDFGNMETQKAEKIAEISVPAIPNGLLTGGDISPDGRRVIICDYTKAYEFTVPDTSRDFEDIWKQQPEAVELGKRKAGESVCYSVDGSSIFAGSEGSNSPIIEVRRRQ